MNKKRLIIIISVAVLLIINIIVAVILITNDKKKYNNTTTTSTTSSEVVIIDEETTTTSTTTETTTSEVIEENTKTARVTNNTTKDNSPKTVVEERTERTPVKYGVTRLMTYSDTYKVYSDGRKELVLSKEKSSKIDYSTYSATTNDLKAEASTLAAQNKAAYQEMLGYVNELRASVGANPLTLDNNLSVAATVRALEIAWSGKFAHERPDGSKCFTVMNDLGITSSARGENIAGYSSNVKSTFEQWKESQGHYENMVSTNFTKIGVGKVTLNNKSYWVQLFMG